MRLSSWLALVRLATSGSVGWYKAWTLGEWSSPDPVALFELFSANAVALGDIGRAKGPFRWINALAHRLRDNAPRKARAEHRRALRPRQRFLFRLARRDDDLFVGALRVARRQSRGRAAAQDPHVARPARSAAGPAPARDRLRLGHAGDRSGEARRVRRRADACRPSRRPGPSARSPKRGLGDRIEIRLQDYRDTAEQFDAVASVEMVEAVGRRWWGAYLDSIARNLKPGGRAALQFISIDHRSVRPLCAQRRLHPDLHLPRRAAARRAAVRALARERGLSGRIAQGFGLDYAETSEALARALRRRRWRAVRSPASPSRSTTCGAII